MRKELRASGVPKLEIEHAFEDWLAGKTPNVEHSKTEMAKVKKYFDL
ncbi:MAG: hypothetical protein JSS36_02055 [Proteobacteria bacterium]|nr:hypothetical protein [Pseudomonadota bacterium]